MTTGNLSTLKSPSTKDAQHSHSTIRTQNHPPNNRTKMHEKMEVVNKETKDKNMEDAATTSSSTTPLRTLARLAAKLKKLMKTDMHTPPMEVMMELDIEELKK